MKKETRGRKKKVYERTSLRVPVALLPKFKRDILEFEIELDRKELNK